MNHCGSCSMCCRHLAIPELQKPVGEWCKHCTPGRGCGAYEARPEPCSAFQCLWLANQDRSDVGRLGPELRPDRAKVMLQVTQGQDDVLRLAVHLDPANSNAWRRGPMGEFLIRMNKVMDLILVRGEDRRGLIPKGSL